MSHGVAAFLFGVQANGASRKTFPKDRVAFPLKLIRWEMWNIYHSILFHYSSQQRRCLFRLLRCFCPGVSFTKRQLPTAVVE